MSKFRLLIVDDDDVVVLALHDYLELRCCEVDTANDYESARVLVAARRYAVALADVLVTGHTTEEGVAFLEWLRGASPETDVVVLSAYRTAAVDRSIRGLGVSLIFDKPKELAHIADIVSTLVSRRTEVCV